LSVVVEPEYEPDTARGTPVNVTTTPIFVPGGAGAWMWAAIAGADRPEKVSVHVDVEVDWSKRERDEARSRRVDRRHLVASSQGRCAYNNAASGMGGLNSQRKKAKDR